MNVIFAEDDEINFLYIENIVKKLNPEKIHGFRNGEKLLELLNQDADFDLAVLDIQLPKMNGVECLKEIKKINKDIKVIALTAYAMKSDKEKLLNLGFDGYLPKPVLAEDLIEEVKILCPHLKNH